MIDKPFELSEQEERILLELGRAALTAVERADAGGSREQVASASGRLSGAFHGQRRAAGIW